MAAMPETQDMYLAYTRNAIRLKTLGDGSKFDELCRHLQDTIGAAADGEVTPSKEADFTLDVEVDSKDYAAKIPGLTCWLSAISHLMGSLERTHIRLVETILTIPWTRMPTTGQGQNFVKSYIELLGQLASARLEFVGMIIKHLVFGMTYDAARRISPIRDESSPSRKEIYDRVHEALETVQSIAPTALNVLQRALSSSYPHQSQPQSHHTTFARNCLRILTYAPELRAGILNVLIAGAIAVDVEVQIDLEDLEDDKLIEEIEHVKAKETPDDLFGMDFEEDSEDESSPDNEATTTFAVSLDSDEEGEDDFTDGLGIEAISPSEAIKGMIRKLDAILSILFDYITLDRRNRVKISGGGMEKNNDRLALFKILLTIFDSTIMPTFKSRYTQFLIFWFAGTDHEACDLFLGTLVGRSLDEGVASVTRVSAVAYTASFVSRAKAVNGHLSQTVTRHFCAAIQSYLNRVEQSGAQSRPDANKFPVFYALTQAVFYIFCFRWRDLRGVDDNGQPFQSNESDPVLDGPLGTYAGVRWMPCLAVLNRAVHSTLNPLLICSPDIVGQFEQVAHMTNFLFVGGIIEANRRSHFAQRGLRSDSAKKVPMISSPAANGKNDSPMSRDRRSILAQTGKINSSNPSTPVSIQNPMMHQDRSQSASGPNTTASSGDLHSFFPFDPHNLPSSKHHMDGIYRSWSEVVIDSVSTEGEDSETTEGEAESEVEFGKDISFGRSRQSRKGQYMGAQADPQAVGLKVRNENGYGISIGQSSDQSEYLSSELSQSLDAMSVSPAKMHWPSGASLGSSESNGMATGYELSPVLARYD